MKIDKQSLAILKNFASINGNFWAEPGTTVLTKSTANNITAEAKLNDAFTTAFGIYDLNEFLGVLSLFTDPELTFTDKYVTISEGKNKVKYYGADKSILTTPKKQMSFELVGAEEKVSFQLSAEQFQQINKTAGVLRAPDVRFVGDGKTITAVISNAAEESSNAYSMEICESSVEFSVLFKVENFKLVSGDYDVVFGTNNVSRFTNGDLLYHIAIESATFE